MEALSPAEWTHFRPPPRSAPRPLSTVPPSLPSCHLRLHAGLSGPLTFVVSSSHMCPCFFFSISFSHPSFYVLSFFLNFCLPLVPLLYLLFPFFHLIHAICPISPDSLFPPILPSHCCNFLLFGMFCPCFISNSLHVDFSCCLISSLPKSSSSF